LRKIQKGLLGAALGVALATGAVVTSAGAASAADGNYRLCDHPYLGGECPIQGDRENPPQIANLHSGWNFGDRISSIKTNSEYLYVFTDINYRGTSGYFGAWTTYNTLSSTFDDKISSIFR
jgi:hypothetical protein